MDQKFRESKYQNESGTKVGSWHLNRMDYFQFHQYPGYNKYKFASLIGTIMSIIFIIETMQAGSWFSLLFIYMAYFSALSFNILRTRICRYNGYFLYPTRIIRFLREREIQVDLDDFDSIATMQGKTQGK